MSFTCTLFSDKGRCFNQSESALYGNFIIIQFSDSVFRISWQLAFKSFRVTFWSGIWRRNNQNKHSVDICRDSKTRGNNWKINDLPKQSPSILLLRPRRLSKQKGLWGREWDCSKTYYAAQLLTLEKCYSLFFHSLVTVCSGLLPFDVKVEKFKRQQMGKMSGREPMERTGTSRLNYTFL